MCKRFYPNKFVFRFTTRLFCFVFRCFTDLPVWWCKRGLIVKIVWKVKRYISVLKQMFFDLLRVVPYKQVPYMKSCTLSLFLQKNWGLAPSCPITFVPTSPATKELHTRSIQNYVLRLKYTISFFRHFFPVRFFLQFIRKKTEEACVYTISQKSSVFFS